MNRAVTLAIVGPTASGKTAVSVSVAKQLNGEIISMDSRQLYRGMDIGTAKATAEERGLIPHHGLDLAEPGERYSAGKFARYARDRIADIHGRGRPAILVGGTGFFLRALINPIFREPEMPTGTRRSLAAYLEGMEADELHRWLEALDPASAERLATWGGRQRVFRALELPLLTGRTLDWWHDNSPPEAPPVQMRIFSLQASRSQLNQAIDKRITQMLERGLVDEVRNLVNAGYNQNTPGMNATGYAESIQYLRGEITLEDAAGEIGRRTRAYAKRQRTWFRTQLPEDALALDAGRSTRELAREIVAALS